MNYLDASEYLAYGLEATTDSAWVTAASAVIDAHCRRATLAVNQYQERIKLVPVAPASTPIVELQGRYGIPRRGEWPLAELSLEFAVVFSLPGSWTKIDP